MATEIHYYLCNRRREVLYQYGYFTPSVLSTNGRSGFRLRGHTILHNTNGDCPVCGIRAIEEEM